MAITTLRNPHQVKSAALKPRDVLLVLTQKGLLDPDRVINNSTSVRSVSYRNHNYFVETDGGPSYFVKQGITEVTLATIRREAAFYEFTTKSFSAFGKHLPRFICFIPD